MLSSFFPLKHIFINYLALFLHVMLEILSPLAIATSQRGIRTFQCWLLHLLLKTTGIISFPGSTYKSCQMMVWNKTKQNRRNDHKESYENCLDFHSYSKLHGSGKIKKTQLPNTLPKMLRQLQAVDQTVGWLIKALGNNVCYRLRSV